MNLKSFSINSKKLDIYILVLAIYSLLLFSADGILSYGSIPTYLILLGLFVKILKSPKYLMLAKYEQPFLLFLFCLALSVLLAPNTAKLSHIQSFLLMFLTYIYARSISIPKEGLGYLIWIFSSFLLLNLLLMTAQLTTGNPALFLGSFDYLIPTGISGDQHMNAMLINISYAFIQTYFIRKKHRAVAAIFFVLCLFYLVINTSRAGLVTFFVTTAYISTKILSSKSLIMLLIGFGGILLSMYFEWNDVYLAVYELLPTELNIAYEAGVMKYTAFFTDDSVSERYTLWSSLMNLSVLDLMKMLTLGLGPGSFDTIHSQTIHNTLFDVLISVGLIGLFSLGMIVYRVVRRAVSRIDRTDCFALSAVVVSIVVSSMFHDFGRTRFLWLFLGLTASCCHIHPYHLDRFKSRFISQNNAGKVRET